MRNIGLIIILLSALFSSCSFDRYFLAPEIIPPNATEGFAIDNVTGDTVVLQLSNQDFQPRFTDLEYNPLELDFTIESIVMKNNAGNKLNGWFLKPKQRNVEITLLFLHGNSGNITTHYSTIKPLLNEGFQVFIPDYTGYGLSQGFASRKQLPDDAFTALNYLKMRPDVRRTKLLIYGQSLGGHLAAIVAVKNQELIDGLIMEGAFSSHKDIASRIVKPSILGRLLVKEEYSAIDSIGKFNKPLLVVHSTEDKVIPYVMSEKIFSKANEPKMFYTVAGCHMCAPILYTEELANRIKHMVGSGPSTKLNE